MNRTHIEKAQISQASTSIISLQQLILLFGVRKLMLNNRDDREIWPKFKMIDR